MERDGSLDFNFWPSFADLMLALVLILVLVLFLISAVITMGSVNLKHVERHQGCVIDTIAESYHTTPMEIDAKRGVYGLRVNSPTEPDIVISNEPTLQRITFSDNVLFEQNDIKLKPKGEEVLDRVGEALKNQLPHIREIQIQGHADNVRTKLYGGSNMNLAFYRGMSVFTRLQGLGIDPSEHLMSVNSFGEYRPVARKEEERFNMQMLDAANATGQQQAQNRRIELLLFYRLSDMDADEGKCGADRP